jgi:hypothetical protein
VIRSDYCRRTIMRILAAMIALSIAPSAFAADASALCAGWNGKWRSEINTERQADGSWKDDNSDPDWRVETTAPGKCNFFFGSPEALDFAIDTTSGDYVATGRKDGKPQPPEIYRFVRSEIGDERHWSVEVVRKPRAAPGSRFVRMTMIMAGEGFFISIASAPAEAGPYQLTSYTTHRRRP